MLSDDIRSLVAQGRRNLHDAEFLRHVFTRLEVAAAELETMEESAMVVLPDPPGNVVSLAKHRERRDA